ncbi:class III extradiol dioxygenase family protein [Kordiimonas marina]|uniref:class III extradiol dioxygenase family protein n=1 Tax=Kordiimonas marina TaxID=2872312 RepID=UPI001FF320C9|nr:class III extradiol dioxygenase family protein [Kordiimonas marina]MCJ9427786.1 hypothetical protein [Kordiimonas marina]
MANIVGSITTSHIPAIGGAIAKGLQDDPYWEPFFSAFPPVHDWLADQQPDMVVVFYNDHGLNFFLDKMPTFAIGCANAYNNADEGWGLPVTASYPGDAAFSWHIAKHLIEHEFDMVTCQEMLVDHALTVPYSLTWPGKDNRPVKVVPININTVQHPLPSAARCYKLGKAVGDAIRSYGGDEKVVILGTGGLSHQLDGQRAGFINKKFDLMCLDTIIGDPETLTRYSNEEIVELAGTQGVEFLMWIAARGALGDTVSEKHRTYHIPISNTAAAVQLLETPSAVAA